jgi:hypothetical protein
MAGGRTVNLFLGNHPYVAQETLHDMCTAFAGMLATLGHSTVFSPSLLPPPAINLVFEHFDDTLTQALAPALPGLLVGLICTEPFVGNPMSDVSYRQMRLRNMLRIGKACRFVWVVDPRSFDEHSKALAPVPVYPMPIGYTERLRDLTPGGGQDKIWDICFTGSMTDYREAMFEQLKAAGLSVIHGLFPHFMRQSVMQRSRLQITLKQSEELSLPSQMRMAYCLANDLPIVSDLGDRVPESAIESYVTAVAPAQFVRWCQDYVAGRQDNAAMAAKTAGFKTACRMDRLNAEAIAASFAAATR